MKNLFPLSPIAKHLSALFVVAVPLTCLAADESIELSQVVVTATRTEQDIRTVPSAISVITRERIEASSATTVDQLLQSVPGVYAARMDASSPNRIAQTYTRGLPGNSRTLVLLDGVPMNVLYDGQVDWSQLSTRDIERVEVVRGASSGLYGANAMGGVINILSRAPEPGVVTRLGAEYGSMNSKRLTAAHSRSQDATAFSLSASHFSSDGYDMWRPDTTIPLANRDAMGTVKDNFSAKLLREIDAERLIEAGVSYLKDEATGFYKPATAGYIPQTREQFVPTVRYSQDGDKSSTSLVLYGRLGKQWSDTLTTPSYAAILERGEYEDTTWGLNAQHTRQWTAGQKLTFGAEFVDGGIDNHFTYPGTTRLRDTTGDLRRHGVFVQDEIEISERLRANLAGRYDYWKTGGNQTDTGAGQPNSAYATRSDNSFSPKLGLLYKLGSNTNLRATAGKAFNLPDMFNLYANTKRGASTYWANPDLLPEKVNSYDIGLDHYFGKTGQVKATVYRNEASDFIYSVQRDATNFDKINVGGVVTRGLELEAQYRPLDSLTLSASYTFNDSEIVENASNPALVGKQLTNVPRRQGSLRADWSLAGGARLYAQMNHVGDRFGNDLNTTRYKHYTVFDLGGSYPVRKDISVRLSWANVGDKQYDGVGYIAPGSVVTAGIDARF